jgi:NTP pyrophosphatase (non-canonical NTP hydrolase)
MDIMSIKDVEKFIEWEISRLDKAHPTSSDVEKIFWAESKLNEETGELAEQVLSYLGYQRPEKLAKFDKKDIAKEVADVIFVTVILAKRLGVDVEEALKEKMAIIEERIYNKDI